MAETIIDVAIEKAAQAREQGNIPEIGHYPMLWLEHLAKKRSWEKIETDALRSFHRSLNDRERNNFGKELKAADEQLFVLLRRRVFVHYSKALFCKRMKKNPRTYDWNSSDIEFVNPHLDGVPEDVKREIQDFDEEMREDAKEGRAALQRIMDESINYLDPDND